jgi:hypothetical protein
MFNERMADPPAGMREVVLWERHPARPKAKEPFCTRSQIISYVAGGVEIARAHRYLRPDGTLGASGKPDPKAFFDGETLFLPKSAAE